MLIPALLFVAGMILLIKGGDWFVDGATGIARSFRLPELIIGATVVSIGTTLPEVMVSTASALSGHGEIAYGNAIGSIICNTALIAAITITIRPSKVDNKSLRIPVLFFFATAIFYTLTAYITGYFSRGMGLVLLAAFVAYMVTTVLQTKKAVMQQEHTVEKEATQASKTGKQLLLLVVGAAIIAIGANLLVENGTLIAKTLGVPESVIALTFVALGTSLPELTTAVVSLIKGHGLLSLGNIIGANLFNLALVSGVSITLAPFSLPVSTMLFGPNASLMLDLPLMLLVMLLLTLPALIKGKLMRGQGILLLAIYVAFCAAQFMM